jgi:hypothetical protein
MNLVEAALQLTGRGLSIIPSGLNKRPLIAWAEFQNRIASPEEIQEWFKRYPHANISIVTGKVSRITVVDVDSKKGFDRLDPLLDENLITPIVDTPAIEKDFGQHWYFKYISGIPSRADYFGDKCGIDIRNDGACVLVPPSHLKNGNGYKEYKWKSGLSFFKVEPAAMPSILKDSFLQFANTPTGVDFCVSKNTEEHRIQDKQDIQEQDLVYNIKGEPPDRNMGVTKTVTKREKALQSVTFSAPGRDNTLFHIANCLVKGGMEESNVEKVVSFIGSNCTPPFPEKDLVVKVKSAIQRAVRKEINLTGALREYIDCCWGNFDVTQALQSVTSNPTPEIRNNVRVVLGRFVNEGLIERIGNRNGLFKKLDKSVEFLDINEEPNPPLDVNYPLKLHELFDTHEKNIVVFNGAPNVGKTALLLNCALMNVYKPYDIRYLTSEMGLNELKIRLKLFKDHMDIPKSAWRKIEWIEWSENFHERISPNAINIIDYMELLTDFYLVNKYMTEIYRKLDKGIAIIALQKDPKKDYGRGGLFGVEKPRLVVNLDFDPPQYDVAKIVKLKNRKDPVLNFTNATVNFSVQKGCKIQQFNEWQPAEDRRM